MFEKQIHNDKEIAKLKNEYKEKYGDTEIIEPLIKEYVKIKKKKRKN